MKKIIIEIIGAVAFAWTTIFVYEVIQGVKKELPKEESKKDPFRKVGVLATKNGLIAELFNVEGCYILVTTAPMDQARGMFQLECP